MAQSYKVYRIDLYMIEQYLKYINIAAPTVMI